MRFSGFTCVKILSASLIFLFSSCNVAKRLPADDKLYKGADIQIENGGFFSNFGLKGELSDAVQPEPNRRILGIIPFRLWLYQIAGDSVPEKGLRHWLKEKVGEPPVIYNDAFPERSGNNIRNYLFNHGYFDSDVDVDVLSKKHSVSLQFNVKPNEAYTIREYFYPEVRDSLTFYIQQSREEALIESGETYNLDELSNERNRINDFLKNNGFYAFSPEYLIFRVDSNVLDKKLKVYLEVKSDIPETAFTIYRVNDVFVYPDFVLGGDTQHCDTTQIRSYSFITCNPNIRPVSISRALLLEKGDIYSLSDYNATLNKIMGLGMFKFANIEFTSLMPDTALLNAGVYLTQVIPRSFRAELQAVSKSNDFVGPGLNLSYTDRNFFRGAEMFSFSMFSGLETQFSGRQSGLFSYEIRLESEMLIPRFIVPFVNANNFLSRQYTAHTNIRAAFGFADRVNYFTNRSVNLSYGYTWRETPAKSHDFTLINIDYSNLGKIFPLFDSLLSADELVRQSFQDRFIFSLIYNSC
ncbi:MAG: hypothetical protein HC906_09755 [Bacteroidales bacterium]|nr:hypothetical protein [Bacteroidales bacterium]